MEGYQKRALLQNLQSGRPDRELYARAAVWLLPVEFPGSVPEDADAWKEEMQAGIRDVCGLEEALCRPPAGCGCRYEGKRATGMGRGMLQDPGRGAGERASEICAGPGVYGALPDRTAN